MKVRIKHHTEYLYNEAVFIEPQCLYFFPEQRPYLKVLSFDLKIDPEPVGMSSRMDAENNIFYQCWFQGLTNHLKITTKMEVETSTFNPFDFLIKESGKAQTNPILRLYTEMEDVISQQMIDWILSLTTDFSSNPIGFLGEMCEEINRRWPHELSYDPVLMSPVKCFHASEGSCRDLSWMMINMLRHEGVPCRFVSGYGYNPELEGHELHAWVEAWVDGAGWVGLDPSAGLLTDHNYIPVCSSYHPSMTLPVQGSYRGNATSELNTEVMLELI